MGPTNFKQEEQNVSAWLRKKGIRQSLRQLRKAGSSAMVPKLLELCRAPFSIETRTLAAEALFECDPTPAQKRKAIDVVLTILEKTGGRGNPQLLQRLVHLVATSTMIKGVLSDNVHSSHVHRVGKLLLDTGYGSARKELTYALRKIGNAADAMEVNDDVRFRFTVNFEGKPTPLWIELFCDDENVCDPAIFAAPKLINRIDQAIEIKD